jgi:Zn-dependent protease with chaperone function
VIAALILGAYAGTIALRVPVVLGRYWPSDRAPRLTVAMLQVLSCSFLVAAATCGLALGVTLVDQLAHMSAAIDACADRLPINDDSPVGPYIGELGLAVSAGLAVRIVYCVVTTFGTARLRRRAHTQALRMLAVRDDERDMLVLDHQDPACYCLPGRPGTVVITSGALDRLSPGQLTAVLAHERAHLSGRHHFVVAFAFAVRRSVPGIRLLKYAEAETRRLVELIADDAAARESGAPTLAAALAVIGTGHVPAAALSMGGRDLPPAVARVARLVGTDRQLRGRARVLSLLAAAAVVLAPFALAGLSLFALMGHCGPDTDGDAAGSPARVSATVPTASGTAADAAAPKASGAADTTANQAPMPRTPSGTAALRLPDGR